MISEKKYDKLCLYVESNWSDPRPYSPYPSMENDIKIEKNETTNKFHLIDEGIEGSPWYNDIEYDSFEDAFQYLYNHEVTSFCCFQIRVIKSNRVYFYTKKLIERLNKNYYRDEEWLKIESFFKNTLPLESFKEKLGINVRMVVDALQKGIQIIKITKYENKSNEVNKFLVGKISTEGNIIKITDENENILYLTTSDNITIETEMIKEKYYWYFNK